MLGAQIYTDDRLNDMFPYSNEIALFKDQWQSKTAARGLPVHCGQENDVIISDSVDAERDRAYDLPADGTGRQASN